LVYTEKDKWEHQQSPEKNMKMAAETDNVLVRKNEII